MPLTILAAASGALKAIQQGCELYKEFKDVVAEAKETYDEVSGEVEEVIGIWSFIKSKLFPPSPDDTINKPLVTRDDTINSVAVSIQKKPKVQNTVAHSEIEVTKNLLDNLKIFFNCQTQLQAKVQEAEEASLDESKNAMDSALDIEYALTEVEKMQKQIRETMVYQSPPELGALYSKVVARMGIIKEQQLLARREALIKARREAWQREQQAHQVTDSLVITLVALVLLAEIWAILIAIQRGSS